MNSLFLTSIFLSLGISGADDQKVNNFILHHIANGNQWHPLPGVAIPLPAGPVICGMNMGLSVHVIMLFIAAAALFLIFGVLCKKEALRAPRGFSNLLEVLALFVRNEICFNYLGEKDGRRLAPWFLNFFFLILILNLMGMIPLFATATANINVTMGFALITLTMMVVGGVMKNGPLGFIKIFMPPGMPWPVYLVLFPVEFIGLFIKPLALTLRLFANMLGGHIVIYSVLGLILIFGYMAVPSFFLALFIALLEVLVAFIQSFIFTLLSAMFVGAFLHPEH